jgi:hypothetical protein
MKSLLRPVAKFVGQQLLVVFVLVVIAVVALGGAFVLAAGTWLAVVLTGYGRERAGEAVAFIFALPIAPFAFAALYLPCFVLARAIARSPRRHPSHRAIKQIGRVVAWLTEP